MQGLDHDLVLVDCPPSLGLLTINGLFAADAALVVTEPGAWATDGVAQILRTVARISDRRRQPLRCAGIAVNRLGRTRDAGYWHEQLRAAYPELVLTVTRETLDDDAPVVRAAIRALQRGYGEAQTDPESAVATMVADEPELDAEQLTAQFDAVAPAFTAGARAYGELRRPVLEQWADWDVEFGILDERPDVGAAFDTSLVGPMGRD